MDPVVVNGQTIYYRGFINLNAVIDDLVANHNLGSATELVLSGDSAGGLATYWHVDHWQGRLPSTRVRRAGCMLLFECGIMLRFGHAVDRLETTHMFATPSEFIPCTRLPLFTLKLPCTLVLL